MAGRVPRRVDNGEAFGGHLAVNHQFIGRHRLGSEAGKESGQSKERAQIELSRNSSLWMLQQIFLHRVTGDTCAGGSF